MEQDEKRQFEIDFNRSLYSNLKYLQIKSDILDLVAGQDQLKAQIDSLENKKQSKIKELDNLHSSLKAAAEEQLKIKQAEIKANRLEAAQ